MSELRETTLQVGDHRHTALAAGPDHGEPVLLLHGWPEFADSWTAELHALGDAGYHAVAVDQRGYAREARPVGAEHYSIDALVADALSFADTLTDGPSRRLHLVSHDWGGMVAWVLATRHPERLKSLTVLSTPHPAALQQAARDEEQQNEDLDYVRFFRAPGGVAEASMLADGATRLRAAYAGRIPQHQVESNVARLSEPGVLTATLSWYRGATDDEFTVPAGHITVPTLYLWGAQDTKLGRTAAMTTAQWVTAPYRFEIFEDAGHWLPEEAPERINPLLIEHLSAHN
ncbi:alpha/beta hydrolase [Amycolatopsis rhabdoformis]|uniref:Alpha/beta hydrolase n=1 Tax=Amycolatopsis rhabdoformis TaxID=1448059 RepID=A0ABZ1I5J7_9PSEU|nr:alpha/beta hydrolase [Amycolatopsis rhabdoformis]WSE29686.1 alpha/beta hydrolase [Amycolatopsis rhabdoformis]